MLRRDVRLRKEYLYKKSLEGKEKDKYEKKRKIRKALDAGTHVPTEIREEADELIKEIQLEDNAHKDPGIDDEYARAGIENPKVVITTSHDPSARLRQFVKEIRSIIPNSEKMNRGTHGTKELMDACRSNEVNDVIIIHEHRGNPDGLIISHLPYGPTVYFGLLNCVMRHDIADIDKSLPEQYPHLIFNNLATPLGERLQNVLKYLFPVPKEESKRVVTFSNKNDFISFRQHVFKKEGKHVVLRELGPRFEMKLYKLQLGTLEMKDADIEWVLRPYMNTTKKRTFLSTSDE